MYHWPHDLDLPVPEIGEDIAWIWRAWHRLHRERPWNGGGMGPSTPGPIPLATVVTWADLQGYDREEIAELDVCVVAMDDVFLKHHAARAAQ